MSYIVVDVESDGPAVGLFSMVCFGAVSVKDTSKTFYGETAPISDNYDRKALSISGITREEHKKFESPGRTMFKFLDWLKEVSIGKPTFISDNPAFDWQWINYYFWRECGKNPFGFSGRRIGDLYCGMQMNASKNSEWKKLYRKTKHNHNPVMDALGNAEALLQMKALGLDIKF